MRIAELRNCRIAELDGWNCVAPAFLDPLGPLWFAFQFRSSAIPQFRNSLGAEWLN